MTQDQYNLKRHKRPVVITTVLVLNYSTSLSIQDKYIASSNLNIDQIFSGTRHAYQTRSRLHPCLPSWSAAEKPTYSSVSKFEQTFKGVEQKY